ncbi:Rab-GAP TBC domain-containing protein [Entamoeba marina]
MSQQPEHELSAQHLIDSINRSDLKEVKYLLEKKPSLVRTPLLLHYALQTRTLTIIEMTHYLLTKGCFCNEPNSDGSTPLHLACLTNNLILVQLLVQNEKCDIDINATDDNGQTPLHIAALSTCPIPSIVQYLIHNGASIVTLDNASLTPFDYAEKNKHFAKAQLLNIEEDPEVDENHTYDALNFETTCPVIITRKERHADNVKWLVIVGQWKSVSSKIKNGMTPGVRQRIWECFTNTTSGKAVREEYLKAFGVGCKLIPGSTLKMLRQHLNVFPEHRVFVEQRGVYKLERLVISYLCGDEEFRQFTPSICKIAGLLLCCVGEEVAFSILKQLKHEKFRLDELIDETTPEHYFIFPRLFKMELCTLYEHLSSIGFELQYLLRWFGVIYIGVFPYSLLFRVWDFYLFEGNEILYSIALNYLKFLKGDLLKTNSAKDAYTKIEMVSSQLNDSFIQTLTKDKIDKTTLNSVRMSYRSHCNKNGINRKTITM